MGSALNEKQMMLIRFDGNYGLSLDGFTARIQCDSPQRRCCGRRNKMEIPCCGSRPARRNQNRASSESPTPKGPKERGSRRLRRFVFSRVDLDPGQQQCGYRFAATKVSEEHFE